MSKSKFLSDAEQMKEKLDSVSPSLCLAKWKQCSLHLTTGLTNSCYHPPLHKIDIETIKHRPSALHNTEQKLFARNEMMNGKRPAECNYCWAMEDNGQLSDRYYRSGEPWAAEHFDALVADPYQEVIPSYVEVNFSHACNMTCSYCSPQFSSSWMIEAKLYGPYPTSHPHNDPKYFDGRRKPIPNKDNNPYVQAFWRWWPDLYPELKHFRMTGGEPLMDKNTYKVFDYVLANPKKDLHLNVTSNFSVEQKLWNKYLEYVKQICDGRIEHFMQYVSVDTYGSQAEYIRQGLNFETLKERVEQYLTEVPSYNSLTFIITMNNLSIFGLDKLLEWILDLRKRHSTTYQRVWFDTPVLRTPEWQSMQILPKHYASRLRSALNLMQNNLETTDDLYHGFKDFEVQRMERDLVWMEQENPNTERLMGDFYRFFKEYDRRHNIKILDYFPGLVTWLDQCKYYANR